MITQDINPYALDQRMLKAFSVQCALVCRQLRMAKGGQFKRAGEWGLTSHRLWQQIGLTEEPSPD